MESISVEVNLISRKWLLLYSYNLNKNLLAEHIHCIGSGIILYLSKYNNFIAFVNIFLEQLCDHTI